jgi:hypothetical protein
LITVQAKAWDFRCQNDIARLDRQELFPRRFRKRRYSIRVFLLDLLKQIPDSSRTEDQNPLGASPRHRLCAFDAPEMADWACFAAKKSGGKPRVIPGHHLSPFFSDGVTESTA